MSKYDFSSDGLLSLVPMALRKPYMIKLLKCLLVPVTYIHQTLTSYMNEKEYRLSHSGQVYALTQVVCDFCRNNGCYITDGSYIDEVMIPYDGDGELIHYQTGLPYDADTTPQLIVPYSGFGHIEQADFIIHLPAELAEGHIYVNALRQLVDEYKLAGKFYDIVFDGVETETYAFRWSAPICQTVEVSDDEYDFQWSEPVCVQEEQYGFKWSSPVCVQEEQYSFAWSDTVCVEVYTDEI